MQRDEVIPTNNGGLVQRDEVCNVRVNVCVWVCVCVCVCNGGLV